MKDISRKRHIAKTITWRLIATATTIALAWIISGDPMVGLKVGGWEFFIKMFLYYVHERAWYKVDFGLLKRKFKEQKDG
tara:strand:- start:632569 stop:632805 length:237 start_codon:yes stop_codon:yes gene_type:complete